MKKDIAKFRMQSWIGWGLPVLYAPFLIIAIKTSGFTLINIIFCGFLLLLLFISQFLYKTLTCIAINRKQKIIEIQYQNGNNGKKIKAIPFERIDYFEIFEDTLHAQNNLGNLLLSIHRTIYSDGSKVQQLKVVYNNRNKTSETIVNKPELSLINELKKDFEVKFQTKWIKLRFYSYARVYMLTKAMILLFLIISIVM